jgi:hypothetical protein
MRKFKNFTGLKDHPSATIRNERGYEKDEFAARTAIL